MYKEENSIKIILLGEAGAGKTNLIGTCCGLEFNPNSESSSTSSFLTKTIEINNTKFCLNLWDTAGQEKFRSLNTIFIKNSQICILVYDITKRNSFEELDFWKQKIEEQLGDKPVIGIAANKADLYENEQVSEEEGKEYANKIGASFAITSAKKEPESFQNFVSQLVKQFLEKNKFNQWEFVSDDKVKISSDNDEKNMVKKKKKYLCFK